MSDLATQKKHRMLEKASKNFLLLPPVSIGRKEMIITLPSDVRNQIIKRLMERGDPVKGVDFRVRLFGADHDTFFKPQVLAPRAALRTFMDNVGTPTGRKIKGRKASSDRALPVGRLTDYLEKSKALIKAADGPFNDFCSHYDEHLQVGRESVDHNFPFLVNWGGEMVPVSEVISHKKFTPDLAHFRKAFYVELPVPRRMTLSDFSDLNLPADVLDKWAEQELAAVEEQLDNAKERLIEKALKLLKRVNDQLDKDPDKLKLYDTLITDAAALSESLKGMVEGYDPSDLQLRNAAVLIQEKIGSIESTDVWRNSTEARQETLRAVKAAGKVFTASKKIIEKKRAKSAPVAASVADDLMTECGMLADIL